MSRRAPKNQAAAAAARERRLALLRDVAEMDGEQRAAALRLLSIVNTEGHNLSPKNCLMIAHQAHMAGLPVPSIVGGFRQWRGRGRVVSKGMHGLSVCFPRVSKDDEGNENIDGYSWGVVFDISQTVEAKSEEIINMAEKYEEWAATWATIEANDLPLFQAARRREAAAANAAAANAAAGDAAAAPAASVASVPSVPPAPSVAAEDPAAALLAAFAAA